MDKLKENFFPISVGAIAVALLALAYFLIYVPLSALNATETRLAAATKKLKNYAKMDYVPTEPYVNYYKNQTRADEADVDEAAAFYEEKVKRFNLFFDDRPTAPPVATFAAELDDRKERLLKQYQTDFSLEPLTPGLPQEGPPTVTFLPPALPSEVPMVMKEFWIFEEILKACTELEIDGLQKLTFAARSSVPQEELFRRMQVDVLLDVPYSKIEDLISKLFASDRVAFMLNELTSRNQQGPVEEELAELVKVREFVNRSMSDSAENSYQELYPEPACGVELKLDVLDFTGIPAAPDEE